MTAQICVRFRWFQVGSPLVESVKLTCALSTLRVMNIRHTHNIYTVYILHTGMRGNTKFSIQLPTRFANFFFFIAHDRLLFVHDIYGLDYECAAATLASITPVLELDISSSRAQPDVEFFLK